MATTSAKGNPASKRMQNEKLKAKRQRGWKNAQEAKAARIADQKKREAHNRALRSSGQLTAWEKAKLARKQRRSQRITA